MSLALQRRGHFVILRQTVTTSGRKLRAYSAREIGRVLIHLAWNRAKNRTGLEIWYGLRRDDPQFTAACKREAPSKSDGR